MASSCAVCKQCFGARDSTVPFYKETKRKELVSTGEPVKIANLLEEIGISIKQATKYVCKKCARKIANCHQLYVEIASSLSLTRDIEVYPSLQELDEKRGPTHSPTGLTPSKKRLKSTRADENDTSRKRLFNSVGDMGDEISNLMSLPVEKGNTTTVKVCFHKISLKTYRINA